MEWISANLSGDVNPQLLYTLMERPEFLESGEEHL